MCLAGRAADCYRFVEQIEQYVRNVTIRSKSNNVFLLVFFFVSCVIGQITLHMLFLTKLCIGYHFLNYIMFLFVEHFWCILFTF